MRKIIFATAFFYLSMAKAQNIVTFTPGAVLHLNATAVVSFDSLTLSPSAPISINGPISLNKSTTLAHPLPRLNISSAYQWSIATPPFSGTITYSYADASLNGLSESALELSIHNGASWNHYNAGIIRNTAANFIEVPNLSGVNLNELTLSATSTALPVRFTQFVAQCRNGITHLTWKTATETHNQQYNVERKDDGNDWRILASIPGAGNSSVERIYSFWDSLPVWNHTVYRIVQIDFNGTRYYSRVIRSTCKQQAKFKVYPNPATNILNIVLISNTNKPTQFLIHDATGRLLQTQRVVLQSGANYFQILIDHLSSGLYFVSQADSKEAKISFIKQ